MSSYTVETYTQENGSNMDAIRYTDFDVATMCEDVRITMKNSGVYWDYAYLSDDETGDVLFITNHHDFVTWE